MNKNGGKFLMDSNIILHAAGPTGGADLGITLTYINVYVNNYLVAYYKIDGKNSITYDLYAATNDGIYLKVHDYNVANNLFCHIKKSIYHNDFGMAVASDITNVNGIIAAADGYIFRIDDLSSYYPIIKFNSSVITNYIINGESSLDTIERISLAED